MPAGSPDRPPSRRTDSTDGGESHARPGTRTPHRNSGLVAAAVATSVVGSRVTVSAELTDDPVFTAQVMRDGLVAPLVLAPSGRALVIVAVIEGVDHAEPAAVAVILSAVPVVLASADALRPGRQSSLAIASVVVVVVGAAAIVERGGPTSTAGVAWSRLALGGEAAFRLPAVPIRARLGSFSVSAHSGRIAAVFLAARPRWPPMVSVRCVGPTSANSSLPSVSPWCSPRSRSCSRTAPSTSSDRARQGCSQATARGAIGTRSRPDHERRPCSRVRSQGCRDGQTGSDDLVMAPDGGAHVAEEAGDQQDRAGRVDVAGRIHRQSDCPRGGADGHGGERRHRVDGRETSEHWDGNHRFTTELIRGRSTNRRTRTLSSTNPPFRPTYED
jgi:hypothetical protein